MTVWIIAAVIVFALLPLLTFRGRTLRRYIPLDLATYALSWVVWRQLPALDPFLACAVFGVAKLSLFSFFLATGEHVRWSANRAALIGLLVYVLVAPAMLRVPIDGDEPYYLLVTESIVRDFDLDLANQYREIDRSATGRRDLRPQIGDPTGPRGEIYSRHEPFLSLLLIPGYLIAGLPGVIATIIVFAVLLLRSTVRMFEDEAIPDGVARAIFPFVAFGSPIIFYAVRLWPEVPAAFFFVETIRGIRNRRPLRWVTSLASLAFLKLRFLLLAVPLVLRANRRLIALLAIVIALPLLAIWLFSGSPTNVHDLREALPLDGKRYLLGLFGLLLDGMSGLLFQAPVYLLGVVAITRWRSMPEGFRLGVFASSLYIFFLIPRSEWHGGWAPPLRYIVFLTPILALGAAALWERWSAALLSLIAIWTAGVTIHGLAYPWRLFHIANGENAVGEYLSVLYRSDFSRLFPSYIRPNEAAWIAAVVFVVAAAGAAAFKSGSFAAALQIAVASIVMALVFTYGLRPADRVQFEDAYVIHRGGELYPHQYTVARFLYSGGWIVRQGDSLSFQIRSGSYNLYYSTSQPAMIELAGRAYELRPDARAIPVRVDRTGRVELRALSGAANLDRME